MSWARIRHGTSVIKGMCEPKAKARPTVCTPSSEAALMMRRTPSQTTSMPESHGDGDLLGTVAVAVEGGLADQHLGGDPGGRGRLFASTSAGTLALGAAQSQF